MLRRSISSTCELAWLGIVIIRSSSSKHSRQRHSPCWSAPMAGLAAGCAGAMLKPKPPAVARAASRQWVTCQASAVELMSTGSCWR
jgi:hypothetical protein